MVRVIGSGFDSNLEAAGRSIPYPVPMTIVSERKHVLVFRINTKINRMKHMSFRLYPKTGPMLEAPDASFP